MYIYIIYLHQHCFVFIDATQLYKHAANSQVYPAPVLHERFLHWSCLINNSQCMDNHNFMILLIMIEVCANGYKYVQSRPTCILYYSKVIDIIKLLQW